MGAEADTLRTEFIRVVSKVPPRLSRGFRVTKRPARPSKANVLVDLQAGLVRQAQVEENDVGMTDTDPLESFGSGRSDTRPGGSARGTPGAPAPGAITAVGSTGFRGMVPPPDSIGRPLCRPGVL